jgi:hypothetical protein
MTVAGAGHVARLLMSTTFDASAATTNKATMVCVVCKNTSCDQLLVDAKGESRISVEDYAVAMLDELEQPKHVRQRFTVGY